MQQKPTLGQWVRVIFYTFHQLMRALSSFAGIVPIFGRIYIFRLALAYLSVLFVAVVMGVYFLVVLASRTHLKVGYNFEVRNPDLADHHPLKRSGSHASQKGMGTT